MTTNDQNSYTGCWTCRLRRKRCDKCHPVCGGCEALEICCYSDSNRPEWMDNGTKQRNMTQRLKDEVKRSAVRRRSNKMMQRIARNLDGEEEAQTPNTVPQPDISLSPVRLADLPSETGFEPRAADEYLVSPSQGPVHQLTPPTSHRLSQRVDNEVELTSVMTYLDYIFPALFPFYTPTLFEGGRSWLLVLPMKIKALYHSVISLTSYFISVVPISSDPAFRQCASISWGEQREQTDMTVKMVQHDLQIINTQGVHNNILESVYLLESIVQLLTFEGIVATSEDWRIHFDAAVVLFEQLFHDPTTFLSVLNLMSQVSTFPIKADGNSFWNSGQAAFRFFSAVLLAADVISSTAFQHHPRLREYHGHLLSDNPHLGREALLQLEDFFGCQNWVFVLIGKIASLDNWKKEMKKHRMLAMAQLMERASVIEKELQKGLLQLNSKFNRKSGKPTRPLDMLTTPNPFNSDPPSDTNKNVTQIWAYAACMYLHIVLSGWQTANTEIRQGVARTIELFSKLPSPGLLRALAWPLCVAGCLADEDQESTFREIFNSMGPLGMLGTTQEVMHIMENVWSQRARIDPDNWDIAACLGILGYSVLLI
ncbi:fungal-specific transcription factor domain-containing protein [Aspergillus californicus]